MTYTSAALHSDAAEVYLPGGLLSLLPQVSPSGCWVRDGEGILGLGVAASTTATGPHRFSELAAFWDCLGDHDGALAFVTATFSPTSEYPSQLILPEVLIRHEAGRTSVLTFSRQQETALEVLDRQGLHIAQQGPGEPGELTLLSPADAPALPPTSLQPGTQSEQHYLNAVTAGLSAVEDGIVEKLVLARDVVVEAAAAVPTGAVLSRLATAYPQTWTYCVSDTGGVAGTDESAQAVLGATPEMLVRLRGRELSSRVLAGTIDHDEHTDALLGDDKQHREHQLAVASLLHQLEPVTETLSAPAEPRILELPNLYHLATDITGTLSVDSAGEALSPLLVAEAVHPTAAVCGTPTTTAAALIAHLEAMDRGPFAGPVGWVDTQGNADFGIALRGGVLDGQGGARLFAGCGVVEGSEPEAELAETRVKLAPMLWALGLAD